MTQLSKVTKTGLLLHSHFAQQDRATSVASFYPSSSRTTVLQEYFLLTLKIRIFIGLQIIK